MKTLKIGFRGKVREFLTYLEELELEELRKNKEFSFTINLDNTTVKTFIS
jgi:hypothetical protein